ncbi:choice-of-anchor M domain-containing protein [Actinophytocola algeriensis]|uniref:Surface-anchored protein n=1 Tax=Actinophytocola algeriensis TaxID=1768010 RepID=A0A7W7Q7X2_9PSEU|nr:choice-of-anchor M domain-containing protein [Actinophytocola algeriensis]MBB4908710.1 surface-anchored protein [Actinophytocola algeriensis]MBE1474903.1 surface-anchored protein [Actinophytocola algeriensis]
MSLTNPTRPAVLIAVAAAVVVVAPPVAAGDPVTSTQSEHSLDTGPVDVAAISLADDATIRLGADDPRGVPQDPESLVYRTARDRVEVGWDTEGIGAGELYGDTVHMRLLAAEGPAAVSLVAQDLPVGKRGTTTWTFPEPGDYLLTFGVEANLLTGEPVRTEERYTVQVRPSQDAGVEPVEPSPPPTTTRAEPAQERVAPAPAAPRAAAPAPTTPGRVVLDEGHVDAVAPRLLDGKLQIQVKDGTTVGQAAGKVHWREPGDVVFHVKPSATAALPDDAGLSFLGKPGDKIFLLPQQQQAGVLWTGWSTEELHAAQVAGPVTWRLTGVDGPGAFGIFTTGSFGDSSVVFNSTDGLPDSHSVALGTHAHANWGFAKQGVYRLTFDTSVTLTGGGTARDTATYTFAVGDVDPGAVAPPGGGDGPGGGSGSDNARGNGDDTRTPGLASTGASGVLPLAVGGAALLGLGGAVVAVGRRRGRSESR